MRFRINSALLACAVLALVALPALAQETGETAKAKAQEAMAEGQEAMAKAQEAKAKAQGAMAESEEAMAEAREKMAEGHEAMAAAEEHMAEGHEHMAEGQPEMSPEEAAMMKAWEAAMTPGAPHADLARSAGHYTMRIKMWMGDPSAEPMVSEGTAHREMAMGGRYLVEKVEGDMGGDPFHGMGYTGYDNTKGTYWSVWVDDHSTGVMLSEGEVDESGKMVMVGNYADPVSKATKSMKSVSWWEGDDKEMLEMYDQRGGEWVRTMEITYVRK